MPAQAEDPVLPLAAGQLDRVGLQVVERPVVVGIFHAGLVEDILVVVQDAGTLVVRNHPQLAVALVGNQRRLDEIVEVEVGLAGDILVQGLNGVVLDQVLGPREVDVEQVGQRAAGRLGQVLLAELAPGRVLGVDGDVGVALGEQLIELLLALEEGRVPGVGDADLDLFGRVGHGAGRPLCVGALRGIVQAGLLGGRSCRRLGRCRSRTCRGGRSRRLGRRGAGCSG